MSVHILCIETSTTVCSVCISDDDKVLAYKEINNGFSHAENLHIFIEEVLREANLSIQQINAISVSKGPGSYTGLRIGVSTAKGLCYALKIPLISIDTLQSMASRAYQIKKENILYCPMLDARRMEVYCAVYDRNLGTILPVHALIINEKSIQEFNLDKPICFFGDGMPKAKGYLQQLKNASFIEDIYPSSQNLTELSYNKFILNNFEDLAYFEPFYLKEFFTQNKI